MTKPFSLLLLSLVLCLACAGSDAACIDTDKDCITGAHRNHVVNQLAYWIPSLEKPLLQRIGPATAELTDYLKLDNILNDFPERPVGATPSPDFQRDMEDAIAELPEPIKLALATRLAGISLVHNLGGSGFTEAITDATGKPAAAYVVLDIDVLAQRNANVGEQKPGNLARKILSVKST